MVTNSSLKCKYTNFLRITLRTIPKPLRHHPEDILKVIRHVVPHLVAGAVALFLVREGLAPEFLGDALFHNSANLAAGGVAFDADG